MEQPFVNCAGFKFYSNFDSANIARVENVQVAQENTTSKVDVVVCTFEFNVWTRPDCAGTEFENGNRTWFYFGINAAAAGIYVRLNIIDINKQAKMYSQGMAPVFKVVPGKPMWERVRDKVTYSTDSENVFSLSFKYRTPDNPEAIVYFAFTYPYSYTDLQHSLALIDDKFLHITALSKDDIYYVRECVCKSVDGRNVDLLTISSYHNITAEREDRLQHLFPDKGTDRPFKFANKKVIFVSARVHPGETPSTFVLNGLLNLLLSRDDAVALVLRRHYVFKLIPFLNPDGVSRGHYRTDTNGTNLNRVYLRPDVQLHPSVYAARALLRYHHHGGRPLPDTQLPDVDDLLLEPKPRSARAGVGPVACNASNAEIVVERDVPTLIESIIVTNDRLLSNMSLTEEENEEGCCDASVRCGSAAAAHRTKDQQLTFCKRLLREEEEHDEQKVTEQPTVDDAATMQRLTRGGNGDGNDGTANKPAEPPAAPPSGLFLYIDMHGHASKKGIFMYGNHFDDVGDSVECMLLPKIMSLNNHNFHFTACNFTERNMYLRDRRDGMSREGSGRVAVLKLTGLVRSYTLECNYNTGRLINALPPTLRDPTPTQHCAVPPKYSPPIFEEVGRALAASILDLTGQNPQTRLPNSEFHTLGGLRQWLTTNCCRRPPSRAAAPAPCPHYALLQRGCTDSVVPAAPAPVAETASSTTSGHSRSASLKQGMWRPTTTSTATRCHHHYPQRHHRRHRNAPAVAGAGVASTAGVAGAAAARRRLVAPPGRPQPPPPKRMPSAMSTAATAINSRRLKLREICWIRADTDTGQGKTLIAKYSTAATPGCAAAETGTSALAPGQPDTVEENLIVSWDSNNANPQVFAQCSAAGSRTTSSVGAGPGVGVGAAAAETAASRRPPTFRVHNFRRRHHCHHHLLLHAAAARVQKSVKSKRRLHPRNKPAKGRQGAVTATAPSTPSTSSAAPDQLQHGRLQRSKRKRKRNKAGTAMVPH